MKVLYITAACLTKNTSANMSHNGYVQGLLENGAELDIIMANDSWGESDSKMQRWPQAHYYVFNSVSMDDRIKAFAKRFLPSPPEISTTSKPNSQSVTSSPKTIARRRPSLRDALKKVFYNIFKQDPLYPLNATWLQNAARFKSDKHYDLVVTNSSPSASHKLMSLLKARGHVNCDRWVQIWEDPWYVDLYGGHNERIKHEESLLVSDADEVYYVSPLTLHYQKILFSDSASKMRFIPLPFLQFAQNNGERTTGEDISFGYFGDYYSHTRNLQPFYDALVQSGKKGYIYGDSNLNLPGTEQIVVSGRVTLDVLEQIQNKTDVLVHLCNLRGGQIPGKIYHYSATTKPILFILDGTDEERAILRDYFGRYNRYVFCDNTPESISEALAELSDHFTHHCGKPVSAFSPKEVVKALFQ